MGYYDTALVCLNGHAICSGVNRCPQLMQKHCSECGASTITKCPTCRNIIRGEYIVDGLEFWPSPNASPPPAYCHECGSPYPWTEARLKAARQLIELSEATPEEKKSLSEDLPALTVDAPQSKVAAVRMSRFLAKAGKEIGPAIKQILVEVATEATKKSLGL